MQCCKPLVLKTQSYKFKALKIQFISLWSLEYRKDANIKAVIHCLFVISIEMKQKNHQVICDPCRFLWRALSEAKEMIESIIVIQRWGDALPPRHW